MRRHRKLRLKNEGLTHTNRKDRFLLSIGLVSSFLGISRIIYSWFLKDMNKVYVTETLDIYVRPEQFFGLTISIVCALLVFRLIIFCYYEARTLIDFGGLENRDAIAIEKKWKEKSDCSYESIFHSIKCYTIFTALFVMLSLVVFDCLKVDFLYGILIVTISSGGFSWIYCALTTTVVNSKLKSEYHEKIAIELAAVIGIVSSMLAVLFFNINVAGNIYLSYSGTSIDIAIESNYTINEMAVVIENSEFYEGIILDIIDEKLYFTAISTYEKSVLNRVVDKKVKPEYLRNTYDDFLYYSDSVDYNDFLTEGENKIIFAVDVKGTTHIITNYVEKNGDSYTYLKESYQREL